VAVIEYNDKEVVWMAEDLRTTAAYSTWANYGGDFNLRTDAQRAQHLTDENGCVKEPVPDNYYNRTDPPAGVYYDAVYLDAFLPPLSESGDNANNRVWQLPAEDDWTELFTAAVDKFGDDNALRHPAFLTNPPAHANAWGMNMLGNGVFAYDGPFVCGVYYQWNETAIYYACKNTFGPGASASTGMFYYWYGVDHLILGMGSGVNARFIYKGDD
jgi:hypothetical protein